MLRDVGEEDEDAALAALAPSIVRRTVTAAASASLMRELGVVDRAEYRPPALTATSKTSSASTSAMSMWTPHLMRVCQTGVQAHVSSVVILRHLWSPFNTEDKESDSGGAAGQRQQQTQREEAAAPPLRWAATLPASVRLQLVSHELTRVGRRRALTVQHLRGDGALTGGGEGAPHDGHTRASPGAVWSQTVAEARAVLRCAAAPWLLYDASGAQKQMLSPLLVASERELLTACLRLAAACQSEDIGLQLMSLFLRDVDAFLRGAPSDTLRSVAEEDAERARVEALRSWYESEGGDVYAVGMDCVAQRRTHTAPTAATSSSSSSSHDGGFASAYSFLAHRNSTIAHLSSLEEEEEGGVSESSSITAAAAVAPAPPTSTPPRSSGSAWSAVLSQAPRLTMAQLRPLADCVDENSDHLDVVASLFWRLLEETDIGYAAEASQEVRSVFCAVLMAVSRVSLSAGGKRRFLDDAYRRAMQNTSSEVLHHPDVLAACLRVSGAAGLSAMSTMLFNKLAEPSSRTLAFQEENMAAACLSLNRPSALLQRCVSLVQIKVPLTADVPQAGVATFLLLPPSSPTSAADTTAAFALLDLLHGHLVQNKVTRGTALLNAERTFFLRVLTLLSGAHGGSSSTAALQTPAAAAIFRQWLSELDAARRSGADRHEPNTPHRPAGVADCSFQPVTVGALQELCLVLERERRAAGATADTSSPLAAEVRRVLAAVPSPLRSGDSATAAIAATREADADAAVPHSLLLVVPPSLQWRQLKMEWPLREQCIFVDAFLDWLSHPSLSRAAKEVKTICLRYQDYVWMDELYRSSTAATAWSAAEKAEDRPQSLQEALQRRGVSPFNGDGSAAASVRVMTPLEEVTWWLQPSASSCISLTEALGRSVPPVFGCPSHTWNTGGGAPVQKSAVAAYWLQRWLDAEEDGCMRPSHSLFRRAVAAALGRPAVAVASAPAGEEAEGFGTIVSEVGSFERGEESEANAPAAAEMKEVVYCDGVEDLLVHGPASPAFTVQ